MGTYKKQRKSEMEHLDKMLQQQIGFQKSMASSAGKFEKVINVELPKL